MKTSIKILLLVVFIAAAVFGVLFYAKTRVAPPSDIETADQYSPVADSICKAFDSATDPTMAADTYASSVDMIRQLYRENAIAQSGADSYLSRLANRYAHIISMQANKVFSGSVWPDASLTQLRNLVATQKQAKLTNGSSALNATGNNDLDGVLSVLNDYDAAWRAARNTRFKDVSTAKKQIDEAERYRNKSPLSNNTQLVQSLAQVREKVEKSHYSHLVALKNALRDYSTYWTWNDYDQKRMIPFDRALKEYDGTSIYGNYKRSTTSLNEEAAGIESSVYYQIGNN